MRNTVIASLILTSVLLAGVLAPPVASASSAGLTVGVEVLPARAAPALVEALPMPAFSRAMVEATGRQAVAVLHAGLSESTGHFEASMPALGYRLVSQRQRGPQAVQLWSRGEDHVRIEFELALGGAQPLVRMRSSGHRSLPALAAR